LRFQIRHDQVEMLEKLKDTEVLLEKKIAKPLNLPIFSNISDALVYAFPPPPRAHVRVRVRSCVRVRRVLSAEWCVQSLRVRRNGSKFASAGKKMKCGREQVFFIGRTDTKSLPKDTSAGDLLLGTLSLDRGHSSHSSSLPSHDTTTTTRHDTTNDTTRHDTTRHTTGTLQVYKKLFADKNKKLAGLPFAYVVQPTSSCSSASASSTSNGSNGGDGKEKEKEQTPEEKLEAFIFEKKVEYADKLLKDKKVQEFDDLSRVRALL
jgi:hypothetical protein